MRSTLFSIIAGVAFAAASPLLADDQNLELITVGSDKVLRWYGHADRTYFIQVSDPNDHLRKWTWAPAIETGEDKDISYEVDGTADKGFFRLWFSDQATTDPDGDDFDGDGLSNLDEVTLYQTNPLNSDTDGDGLLDGWEVVNSLDPNDDGTDNINNGASGDPDHDGLTNEEEQDLGTDPNNVDSDGDGITDGSEVDQGFDPTSSSSVPSSEVLIVSSGEEDVEIVKARTITIPAGSPPYVVIVALSSAEYPNWTGDASEYNDTLRWQVNPAGGTTLSGQVNVNSLHGKWAQVDDADIVYQGLEPVHFAEFKLIQTSESQDTTVEIEAGATNVNDSAYPSTVIVEVRPVDVTAVFGLGPNQSDSKATLTTFLDANEEKRDGDVWFLKLKDKDGNDVFPSVRVAESQAILLGSLKAKDHAVVFDGHSNHGIGPWFSDPDGDPVPTSIAAFTNLGGVRTWIPSSQCALGGDSVDYTGNDHPDVRIPKVDFPVAPANYLVPVLLEPRFANDNNVAPGAEPMAPGQTFTRNANDPEIFHYTKDTVKRAIVKAGKADLPVLAYKKFFYNACNTGRDYIENFDHETFLYTKKTCVIGDATKIFVEMYIKNHSVAEIVTELNQSEAGGEGESDVYAIKKF
jgi:hypothetical protein